MSTLEFMPEYVSLHRDGSSWFIQSECFDYFAAGDTPDKAIDNFWSGLIETIFLHLIKYGCWQPEGKDI